MVAGPSWSWARLDYDSAVISDLLIYEKSRIKSLVTIGIPRIEPLGSDVFGTLKTGYLALSGRIGGIFHITNENCEGEWINGCWSHQLILDLPLERINDLPIRCVPLFAWSNGAGHTIIECLLLQPAGQGVDSYVRAGLLKISVDLKDELPGEVR